MVVMEMILELVAYLPQVAVVEQMVVVVALLAQAHLGVVALLLVILA
jgi:hypothetical protein